MRSIDLGLVIKLDYSIAAKRVRKNPRLEYRVMSGQQSIAVTVKNQVRGYIASPLLLKKWNVEPDEILPYGHLFLSHYGDLWEYIDGKIIAFGAHYPIAIAHGLFKKEKQCHNINFTDLEGKPSPSNTENSTTTSKNH